MSSKAVHILSLDTTSRHSSISVSCGDDVLIEYNFTSLDTLSATLIPAVDFVLNNVDKTPNDIDVFGITTGPGLFTGIRIGLSALKGLLFGQGKPVVPVTTLKALAYKCLDIETGVTVVPIIDARREEVYVAAYKSLTTGLEELIPPQLISIAQLQRTLEPVEAPLFIGSGSEIHRMSIKEKFGAGRIASRSSFLAPETCKIAHKEYLEGNYITDLQTLMPIYIRKPDAELNYRPPAGKV